jgi:hypothetical protein
MYVDRFVFGDCGPGYESYIGFADRGLEPDSNGVLAPIGDNFLALDGRRVQIGTNLEDRVTALVPVMLSAAGDPSKTGLFVLKEYFASLVTGEPNQTTDSGDVAGSISIADIQFKCGCVGMQTVAYTPYGVIWAGPDDVWLFEGGNVPRRLGTKIRSILQQSPPNLRYRWHAAYFNGFYRLAVFSEGQGPSDDSPCGEQWWLDMRHGPPQDSDSAAWFGPMTYKVPKSSITSPTMLMTDTTVTGTWTMAVDERSDTEQALVGMARTMLPVQGGAYPGEGIVQVQYDMPGPGTRDLPCFMLPDGPKWLSGDSYGSGDIIVPTVANGHYYKNTAADGTAGGSEPTWPTNGTSVADGSVTWEDQGVPPNLANTQGLEIDIDILSKDYNFGSPMFDKIYQGLQISARAPTGALVQVDAILDDGREVSSAYPGSTAGMPLTGLVLGVDPVGTMLSKEFQAYAAWANPASRLLGKHIQLHIYSTGSIVLGSDELAFYFVVNGVTKLATLTDTTYTSTGTLLTALVAAMNTAVGGTPFSHNSAALNRPMLIAITHATLPWTILFDSSLSATRGTRRIGALLGYDTTVVVAPTPATVQTAAVPVALLNAPSLELGGIILMTELIPREPA